ncbi:YlzJ-like family protein [Desmospora activa]|uniref:YlzJ-like protein n=1 Tax=Desmospora activa DSM 45169 TaxID=1121389 RepID=A0A2T4ZAN5_9BACL|nr:YlzJ-like family protein [Desmospora activa]PTM58935.1 YlzJ-like protein [Desmospora activa DSM 45169]
MIYYSVIPAETALTDETEISNVREVSINGVMMQVEMIGPGQGRIQRLLSPEPHHYLDARYQPGQSIAIPLQ